MIQLCILAPGQTQLPMRQLGILSTLGPTHLPDLPSHILC